MTREEIEAAANRWSKALSDPAYLASRDIERDAELLADAYLSERAERQRRIAAASEELDSVLTELSCVASPEARQAAIARIITKHLEQS